MRLKGHSNAANDGRGAQGLVALSMQGYAARGIATFHKTDPPVRVIGHGPRRKVIFLKNPFLDYIGTWKVQGGRTVVLEVKSTSEPVLRLIEADKTGGGIKEAQVLTAEQWEAGGAAVAFLWEYQGRVKILTAAMVRAAWIERKSIPWERAHKVPQGEGFIIHDFLACLAVLTRRADNGTLAHEQTANSDEQIPRRRDSIREGDGSEIGSRRQDHSAPGEAGNAANDRPVAPSGAVPAC